MALVPLARASTSVSPYVYRAVNPYLGLLGFNEFSRQGRQAYNNLADFARQTSRLYRENMITPVRLFSPRVRRTPLTRTPRRAGLMRYRKRLARRAGLYRSPLKRSMYGGSPAAKRRRIGIGRNYGGNRKVTTISKSALAKGNYRNPYNNCNKLLGELPWSVATTKKIIFSFQDWSPYNDKELYSLSLIRIPWDDNESVGTRRSTGRVHLTGIKLRVKFTSNTYDNNNPIRIRWAIIVNKESVADTSVPISNTGFFEKKEDQDAKDEGEDFTTGYGALHMDGQRINRDLYCVARQGTFILQRNNVGAVDPNQQRLTAGGVAQTDQFADINQYIRFNTLVGFAKNTDPVTDPTAEFPKDNQVYFVFWAYRIDKMASQNAPVGDSVYLQLEHKCYWKDVGWGLGR